MLPSTSKCPCHLSSHLQCSAEMSSNSVLTRWSLWLFSLRISQKQGVSELPSYWLMGVERNYSCLSLLRVSSVSHSGAQVGCALWAAVPPHFSSAPALGNAHHKLHFCLCLAPTLRGHRLKHLLLVNPQRHFLKRFMGDIMRKTTVAHV